MGYFPKQIELLEAATGKYHRRPINLYGGAGGGGKSHALRAASVYPLLLLASLGIPNQRGILACSTYGALADRHLGKLQEEYAWMGLKIKRNDVHGLHAHFEGRFKNIGVIALRNLEDPNDFRGTEATFANIDETSELPERIAGYNTLGTLLYPLRVPKEFPFSSLNFGSNPDGVGHGWLKKLFILGIVPEGMDETRFRYIVAKSTDNPAVSDEWRQNLNAMDADVRNARLNADWDNPQGMRFSMLDKKTHQFKFKDRFPKGIPAHYQIIMGVDYGLQAPYAATWHAIDESGDVWTYREDYRRGLHDEAQAERILNLTTEGERKICMRCDPAMWSKKPGHSGGEEPAYIDAYERILKQDKLKRFQRIEPGYNKSRGHSFSSLHRLLERGNGTPDWYIEEGCTNLWHELSDAVWDTTGKYGNDSEDIDKRNPFHAGDSCRYALHSYLNPSQDEGRRVLTLQEIHTHRMQEIVEREELFYEQTFS